MVVRERHAAGLTNQVYDHIKESLFDGTLRPGDAVQVEKLARELAVSRQPVMDAMKRLAVEGFVSILPQIGCRVRIYPAREMRDFFLLSAAGEALVARLAAERAEPDELVGLQIISAKIGAIPQKDRTPREQARLYRMLNRQLHNEIRRIARSPALTEAVESLIDRNDFFIAAAERPIFYERLQEAQQEHDAVIDAIGRGDGETAAAVMHKHIMGIEQRLR